MSADRKPNIWTVCSKEELPAPGYSTWGGSGSAKDSRFVIEYEFRPGCAQSPDTEKAAALQKLVWDNGSGGPILTLSGTAGPEMLRVLASQLPIIADRMEAHLEIINQLRK